MEKQKAISKLVRYTAVMFTLPVVLYFIVSRVVFSSYPIHTRQTYGVVSAVIGVLCIKGHFVYSIYCSSDDVQRDFLPDDHIDSACVDNIVDSKKDK